MILASIERCAGIDVGKRVLSVCILTGPLDQEPREERRRYGTNYQDLLQLREWLQEEQITCVAMESTGSYWKPVFNVLEPAVQVCLAQPEQVKARKGHKTDDKDGWWLGHLLRHAMIAPSFIPVRGQRELRDLTRRRKKLLGAATAEKNRVQKILEDASVKLSSVLSDVFGVSGQLMLEKLLEGKAQPAEIAQLAQRKAKQRVPEIVAALEGHQLNDHHRRMIGFSLEHMQFLEQQLNQLDDAIVSQIEALGWNRQWELVQTVPGLGAHSAATVLAEAGVEMQQFPSDKHLGSWAGLCPGNNRSAGRSKSSHTHGGNPWLRSALTECAWAAASKRDCFLKEKFWRITTRRGKKPIALIAIAHTQLRLIYEVLQSGQPYRERNAEPPSEIQKQRLIRHHIRRLGKLGIQVRHSSLAPDAMDCRKRKQKT